MQQQTVKQDEDPVVLRLRASIWTYIMAALVLINSPPWGHLADGHTRGMGYVWAYSLVFAVIWAALIILAGCRKSSCGMTSNIKN